MAKRIRLNFPCLISKRPRKAGEELWVDDSVANALAARTMYGRPFIDEIGSHDEDETAEAPEENVERAVRPKPQTKAKASPRQRRKSAT